MNTFKQALIDPVSLDPFLLSIAQNHSSHRHLGGATQGCYLKQIALLTRYFESLHKRPQDIRVLDWGTGKGQISFLLQKAGYQVTSCDVASNTSDSSFGQKTPIIDALKIPVTPLNHPWELPFSSGTFDLVVSFGVLEHVENDRESLIEIHRVLKKNGIFYFSFLPYWLSWTQRIAHLRGNYYHDRLYRKKSFQQLAIDTGYRVQDVWHGQLFPKNSLGHSNLVEKWDRYLTEYTPLKYFATNLEGILLASE